MECRRAGRLPWSQHVSSTVFQSVCPQCRPGPAVRVTVKKQCSWQKLLPANSERPGGRSLVFAHSRLRPPDIFHPCPLPAHLEDVHTIRALLTLLPYVEKSSLLLTFLWKKY